MQRIALVLLLFILLTNAPHRGQERALRPTQFPLSATLLPLPSKAVQRDYGPLRLTGLWRLDSAFAPFGGLSSLLTEDGERFTGISDSGEHVDFTLGDAATGHIAALPRLPSQAEELHMYQDSESVVRDTSTGRIWVGFESKQRICRYAPGFARIEACGTDEALQAWPPDGSLETLVRFGDGRFLAIGERANAPNGGYDALLWAGDPADPATAPPVHLTYRAPTGFRPTDAVWLGGDRLLVLNRRMTVYDLFTARLVLVRMPKLEAGAVLRGDVIARFERPGPSDNLEALAVSRDSSGASLWIASDDNHMWVQRTLLFRFALPPEWLSDEPAP